MKIALAYIMVPHLSDYQVLHQRFVDSYLANPPGESHSLTVICNGTTSDCDLFKRIPEAAHFNRSNAGWDIGGYLEFAAMTDADMLVCLGSSAYFKKPGWLACMAKAFQDNGPGIYGPCASYQVRPHINTGIFFCSPELLRRFPLTIETKADRYQFEHGHNSFWMMVAREGLPVKLVLWSGNYDWREWRKPRNIYWRGDQSDCVAFWRLNREYEQANNTIKRIMASLADRLTDPYFLNIRHNRKIIV